MNSNSVCSPYNSEIQISLALKSLLACRRLLDQMIEKGLLGNETLSNDELMDFHDVAESSFECSSMILSSCKNSNQFALSKLAVQVALKASVYLSPSFINQAADVSSNEFLK